MKPHAAIAALVLAAAAGLSGHGAASAGGDPSRGEDLFAVCAACHEVGRDARHGIGPALNGVIDKKAASATGFNYSTALRDAGATGLVWHGETLDRFLADPHAMVPGTRMTFPGFVEADQRADVIAYLRGFAGLDLATSHRDVDPTEIGAAAMTIDGDPDYGEYLASECLTCHQASGDANGIPSIVGWDRRAFVRALFAYKTNLRTNDTMKLMTGNLGDAEIAALAAYFERLGQ